jgi:hypothetical protein
VKRLFTLTILAFKVKGLIKFKINASLTESLSQKPLKAKYPHLPSQIHLMISKYLGYEMRAVEISPSLSPDFYIISSKSSLVATKQTSQA